MLPVVIQLSAGQSPSTRHDPCHRRRSDGMYAKDHFLHAAKFQHEHNQLVCYWRTDSRIFHRQQDQCAVEYSRCKHGYRYRKPTAWDVTHPLPSRLNVGQTSVPTLTGPNIVCAYSTTSYYTAVWANTHLYMECEWWYHCFKYWSAITVQWNAVPTGNISVTHPMRPVVIQQLHNGYDPPNTGAAIVGASSNCTQTIDVYTVFQSRLQNIRLDCE
jgi:hypothetical protein